MAWPVYLVIGGVGGAITAFVVAARRRTPEATWEPGLEFNPDFDLTEQEILDDLRGESPSA